MSRAATAPMPSRALTSSAFGRSAFRTERSVALIRLAVVSIVALIYFASVGVRRSVGPLALSVLALAALYGVGTLMAFSSDQPISRRMATGSLLADVAFVTLWCQATGGNRSEFWTLFLIVIISAGLRYSFAETMGTSIGLSILYAALVTGAGGMTGTTLMYRAAVMMVTGFAAGVLAYQRTIHRSESERATSLAEERTQQLTLERQEVDRLRRVDTARSEFVAVVAHEFRSPLAAILGVLNTLRTHGATLDAELREELLGGATTQASRLARLVDDLLTISRIEDGALRLSCEEVEPRKLVAEAAQASGTAGLVNVDLHRVGPMTCDPDAMVRVLTNLLDNARKYSPEGARILLTVSESHGIVRFVVSDQGPGVSAEDRTRIFERFRRLDGHASKPGAGLGLYIARGLVEAHGGAIGVGEGPDGGAEFWFTIPRVALNLSEPLVVEDAASVR